MRTTPPVKELLRRVADWPLLRQAGGDHQALGEAARSPHSATLRPRIAGAERAVASVCPYCAVGCGQTVYVKDGRTLVDGPLREYRVKYRRPFATAWEELPLDQAMDMIAERVIEARAQTWEEKDADGCHLHRSLGVANLGGATLDNEENYTIKKLMSALGFVQVENQARI